MLFNSTQFLIFFPLVVTAYFLIPSKFKYLWLLAASCYFYMCWNWKYIFLIGISTVITYISGIAIEECKRFREDRQRWYKKLICILCLISNLGILFFFKYWNFTINNISILLNGIGVTFTAPEFDVMLPVGISFYTFQALGYAIDVYRGDIYAERNFFKYALFVSFFPQLVAGPIERSKNLLKQINKMHTFDYERLKSGLLLMLWGLFQKIVIADRVSILVNTVLNSYTEFQGFYILIAVMLFAVQIYCDFAGYSDIAIGASEVMGFSLMTNFKAPYYSRSVPEFWRRWHVSLNTWFKDYLYIPLGGNRKGTLAKYRNIMAVFLTSGLWHGASWNYVVWGFLNGFYQVFGDITKKYRQRFVCKLGVKTNCFSYRLFQMLITFLLIDFSWIFFRAPGFKAGIEILCSMFAKLNPYIFFDGSLFKLGLSRPEFTIMVISIILLFLADYWRYKVPIRKLLMQQNLVFRWLVYYGCISVLIIWGVYGIGAEASQFIYFQF